ncbi:hypothetical protein CYMTET_5713 [Cymbomonas tetramitiformis]|uniref:Protein kinase domain-containing protein n=1 Tax=Cymbomonas tetramitiformis TaxID=36881 RepID=A0AAE0GYY7_9CHLO|nr:hypothetical protein CYMTET_5713 [Cymbomonas tetramitiformis]
MTSPDLSAVSTATTIAQRVIKDSTPAILRTLDNLDPRGVHLPDPTTSYHEELSKKVLQFNKYLDGGGCIAGRAPTEFAGHFFKASLLTFGLLLLFPVLRWVGQIHHRYYRAYLAARAKRLEDEKDRIESQDSAYRARFKRKRLQMELDEAKRVAALAVEQQDAAVQEVARLRREKQAALSGTGAAVEAVQEQLKHGGFGTQVKYAEASMEECVEQVKVTHADFIRAKNALSDFEAAQNKPPPPRPVHFRWWAPHRLGASLHEGGSRAWQATRFAGGTLWEYVSKPDRVPEGLMKISIRALVPEAVWATLRYGAIMVSLALLAGALYAGMHWQAADTMEHPLEPVRGLVPDQYLPAVLEDPMTCGEAAELHRDRVIQHLTEYTIWQSEWRGEKVAVHVLKDEFADAAMLRRTRKTASVLRTLRERGASGVITMYAECAGTFVTELLPYTLPEVLRGSELLPPPLPNGSTPWLKWGGERCDAVCGRLQLTPDQEPWCGARPVMPLDEIVRLGAALDAARALEVVHNTTMPAGGTLVHFQLGSGAFKVNARGRLKLGGFDEARMLRGHMYQDASNSGHFCEGPEGPAGPAPETRRGTLQSASYMDAKVDMFGFGDVLYELLGEPRAWRFKNAAQIARKGVRHPDPEGAACRPGKSCKVWWRMLHACWQRDPVSRPSASQVVTTLEVMLAAAMAFQYNQENMWNNRTEAVECSTSTKLASPRISPKPVTSMACPAGARCTIGEEKGEATRTPNFA